MPAGHRVFAARSVLDGREHGGVLDADGATLIPRGARPSGRSPKSRRPINTGYMWNEDAPFMRGFSPPLTHGAIECMRWQIWPGFMAIR